MLRRFFNPHTYYNFFKAQNAVNPVRTKIIGAFLVGSPILNYLNNRRKLSDLAKKKTDYDVVIVGGGHNGLVAANYLAMKGIKVGVVERRYTVGGAAVSEEIFPGFTFSRASYLAGLLRPDIIKELKLKEKGGIEFFFRDPYSFTPHKDGRYLMLGSEEHNTISHFS